MPTPLAAITMCRWMPRLPVARPPVLALLLAGSSAVLAAQTPRPMTFLEMQHLRSAGSFAPSPDGRWVLHTITTPDWEQARSQTDIHVVPVRGA